jgi:riboflavin kinase/FMN adenylyltransferase
MAGLEQRGNRLTRRGQDMQRWQGLGEVPADWGASVVTIGVFDGVHRGHQRIVARAAAAAAAAGQPVVVVTFDPHPDEVVRPGSHPPFLCTVRRQRRLRAALHLRVLAARAR